MGKVQAQSRYSIKGSSMQNQTALGLNPSSIICEPCDITVGQSLNFSLPQFPPLINGDDEIHTSSSGYETK